MEVTARKWRPARFEDFVGQEHVITALKNAVNQDAFGHAYLFSGPRGVGKTSCARVFAKALNCIEKGTGSDFCGKCKNCLEITAGNSVDVIEVDGASNRGIDKIRELKDNIQFLPSSSKYKIYIIDEVHMLTTEAFNALLKTLEEPPSHVLFLFATTEPHKVKITIRSRCQHFRFRRMSLSEIAGQLEKILSAYKIDYEKEALAYIAKAGDGSMRDSQSLLDQAIIYCNDKITIEKVKEILGSISFEVFIDFAEILISEDPGKLFSFIEKIYLDGEDTVYFVENLIVQFRYLLLAKNGVQKFEEIEDSYFLKLKQLADNFTNHQIHRIIELFLSLHKELKTAENERVLIDHFFYQALDYKNFINLPLLVRKIAELEKKLAGETGGNFQEREDLLKKKKLEPVLIEKEEKLLEPNDTIQEEKEDLKTPDEIWKSFKTKVAERSPKWMMMIVNIKTVFYEPPVLKLEFLSTYDEGFFQDDSKLISQIKDYFNKFNMPVQKIETYVKNADLSSIENPVLYIKEIFKGEEI